MLARLGRPRATHYRRHQRPSRRLWSRTSTGSSLPALSPDERTEERPAGRAEGPPPRNHAAGHTFTSPFIEQLSYVA
jgi:hypothetical protein